MKGGSGKNEDIQSHTVALIIGTAFFFDVLQWALAYIFMDWLAGFFAFLTFYVWFKVLGMSFMTPKRMSTMGGAFIVEIIPVLSMLPAWTGAVTILILDHKAKLLLANSVGGIAGSAIQPGQQKGPPLPKRPIRPTTEHLERARSLTQPNPTSKFNLNKEPNQVDSIRKTGGLHMGNEANDASRRQPTIGGGPNESIIDISKGAQEKRNLEALRRMSKPIDINSQNLKVMQKRDADADVNAYNNRVLRGENTKGFIDSDQWGNTSRAHIHKPKD